MGLVNKVKNGVSNYLFGTHIYNMIGSEEKILREYCVSEELKPSLYNFLNKSEIRRKAHTDYYSGCNLVGLVSIGAAILLEEPLSLLVLALTEAVRIRSLVRDKKKLQKEVDETWEWASEMEKLMNEREGLEQGYFEE